MRNVALSGNWKTSPGLLVLILEFDGFSLALNFIICLVVSDGIFNFWKLKELCSLMLLFLHRLVVSAWAWETEEIHEIDSQFKSIFSVYMYSIYKTCYFRFWNINKTNYKYSAQIYVFIVIILHGISHISTKRNSAC